MMPELSGSQVLERLKSHPEWRHIPVIMISASDDTDTIVQCILLGATDYLVKPFNPLILAARINNSLASKTLRDQEDAYRREIEKYNQELEIRVVERTKELHASRREVIVRLGKAAEYRDNETGMHVIRMSQYSHLLAQKAGMNPKACEMILQASPMHDVGKIGIPDNILLKPGKLNHDEWQTMKTHASIGADILAESGSDMLNMAETIARTHHEKYDGTGYPKGLKGEEIPIEGRIIAICDVFDALTSSRPYKKAWTVEEATNFINSESGKHFDPNLVSLFNEFLPEILNIKEQFSD
jgi:putative two-component system response regulator